MKTILFLFLLIGLSKIQFAQTNYWQKKFDHHLSTGEEGRSVLATDSGCIILFGTTDTIGFTNGLLKSGLLFLSDSGSIQLEKLYSYPNNYFFPGGYGTLIKVENKLLFAGSSQNQSNPGNAVLTKFDSFQNIEWQQTYGDTNFQSGWKCQQTRDKGFIIIGQNGVDLSDSSDVLLIKTDSMGNFQWQKLIGGFSVETGLAIDTCIDGGYILTCATLSYGVGAGSGFGNGYIVKTDILGNAQWSRTVGDIYDDGLWNGITLHDGTYLFCGYYSYFDPYYSQGVCCNSESKLYLIHLDLNGSILWERTYDRTRLNNQLYSVKELPDGNLIAAGWFNDTLTSKVQGVLLKLNSNGDTIWSHKYDYFHGLHSVNIFNDVALMHDGGFVATGFINPTYPDSSITGQDLWVVKVDSNGCEMANCLVNAIGEVVNKENNLSVFPNPVSSAVNFQLNDAEDQIEKITLFNSMGQKIKFQNQTEINMNEYSTGIYFYLVYTRKKLIFSGKFIKQ